MNLYRSDCFDLCKPTTQPIVAGVTSPRAYRGRIMQRSAASRPSFTRAARLRRALEAALGTLWGLSNRTGLDLPRAQSRIVELRYNELLRIDEADGARWLEVLQGIVWITATPANGDVVLRAGDCLELADCRPFVAQALEPARLLLSPRVPSSATRMKPLSSKLAPSPKKYT